MLLSQVTTDLDQWSFWEEIQERGIEYQAAGV